MRINGDPDSNERRRAELVVGRRVVVLSYAGTRLSGQKGVITHVDNPGWDAFEVTALLEGWDRELSFFWHEVMTAR